MDERKKIITLFFLSNVNPLITDDSVECYYLYNLVIDYLNFLNVLGIPRHFDWLKKERKFLLTFLLKLHFLEAHSFFRSLLILGI